MPDDIVRDPSPRHQESVWKRLTRLFRSGPVVRHKVAAGERTMEPQGTARAYKKELSSLYVHSLASYGQYERLSRYADYSEMEFCLTEKTLIAVPGGFKTIKELADEYGLTKEFVVYSYDHERRRIVPAVAKQARMTRRDVGYRVTFDNHKEIIGTIDHRLMLRDGSYKKIGELCRGDAMMPFKREHLWAGPYASIYDGVEWIHEHRMLGEFIAGRPLENDEIVHHIDHQKWNNCLENLEVMTRSEHTSHHLREYNRLKWHPANARWIEKFRKDHSKYMTERNPSARLDITFPVILQVAELNDFHLYRTMEILDIDYPTIVRRLQEYKFKNWEAFAKTYQPSWKNHGQDNRGEKNPRWDDGLTFQKVCEAWEPGIRPLTLAEKLGTTNAKVRNRVRQNGFDSPAVFCRDYKNCKVLSVEVVGEMDLYDLTVDGHKNFATDSVISHNTPEICSALDIYGDETTASDEKGHILNVVSKNPEIKETLDTLFYDILNIEFNIWMWTRNLCKYGDFVMFVDASEGNGILNLLPIPINEIEREEGYDKADPFAVRFRWLTQGNLILENWQVIHFRLLGNDNFLPYGSSIIEPARRIWRQLILIEDAMLVYRIVRSPERRVFKIDVGNVRPEDVPQFMEDIKTRLRRNQIVDPSSGRVDLRYNPLSVDEDYFIPVRGDKSSDISTLAGGQFTGDIDDVQYIQNKLFAALKVPKAYLGYEGELGSKATLAQMDVRFSRTVGRIQNIVVSELNKIAIVHLFLLGYEGEDLVDFKLKLANNSSIAEQQKLELWRTRFEIAGTATEGMLDRETVYRDIFGFDDDKIEEIREGKRIDKLEDLTLEAMQAPPPPEGEAPAGAPEPAPEGEGGGEQTPGSTELPDTLGGAEGGGEQPAQNAGFDPGGPVISEDEDLSETGADVKGRNPGSEGDQAELSVSRGKNLFSTGENQHTLAFGREKQTATDPNDMRALRRIITRPFGDSVRRPSRPKVLREEVEDTDATMREAIGRTVSIDEDVREVLSRVARFFDRRRRSGRDG